jgi:hypothetical protein
VSKWEHVQTAIWSDPDFEELTPYGALLYLWSFTNPLCNVTGLYRVSRRKMLESKVPKRSLTPALRDLGGRGFLHYQGELLWVRARVKYLHTSGPNHAKSIGRELALLPERHPLVRAFLFTYQNLDWLRDTLGGFGPPSSDPLAATDVGDLPRVSMESLGTPNSLVIELAPKENDAFDEWMADHERVTGSTPPRPGTQARAEVLSMFSARLAENYSLEELKAATAGAFNDEWRREKGHYGCVSVLRPTKIHELIERGKGKRKAPATSGGQVVSRGVCRDCGAELAIDKRSQGRCNPCQDVWERKLTGEAA